jgi:hypothetical protein
MFCKQSHIFAGKTVTWGMIHASDTSESIGLSRAIVALHKLQATNKANQARYTRNPTIKSPSRKSQILASLPGFSCDLVRNSCISSGCAPKVRFLITIAKLVLHGSSTSSSTKERSLSSSFRCLGVGFPYSHRLRFEWLPCLCAPQVQLPIGCRSTTVIARFRSLRTIQEPRC